MLLIRLAQIKVNNYSQQKKLGKTYNLWPTTMPTAALQLVTKITRNPSLKTLSFHTPHPALPDIAK